LVGEGVEKKMSNESPKTAPLRVGDPPREVQQLIDAIADPVKLNLRTQAVLNDMKANPMSYVGSWTRRLQAAVNHDAEDVATKAEQLSALLTAAGRDDTPNSFNPTDEGAARVNMLQALTAAGSSREELK
jgi:hypothetical protein